MWTCSIFFLFKLLSLVICYLYFYLHALLQHINEILISRINNERHVGGVCPYSCYKHLLCSVRCLKNNDRTYSSIADQPAIDIRTKNRYMYALIEYQIKSRAFGCCLCGGRWSLLRAISFGQSSRLSVSRRNVDQISIIGGPNTTALRTAQQNPCLQPTTQSYDFPSSCRLQLEVVKRHTSNKLNKVTFGN